VPLRTVADPAVRNDLVTRLSRLTPDAPRRWGTLTAHEMLCHLGDATAMVLRDRPRVIPVDAGPRRLRKGLGLWSPLRSPHGLRTSPHYDPHTLGSSSAPDRRAVTGPRYTAACVVTVVRGRPRS